MMKSSYKISITGKNIKRFLKQLIKLKINLYHINESKNQLILICDQENYYKIKSIKTTYKIKLLDIKGIDKYKNIFKRHLIFITLFILGVILLILMSNVILEVEVIHNDKELKELLLEELESHNIKKYSLKVDYQEKEKIIDSIIKKYPDKLEWLEITEVGNSYIIRVEERIIESETITNNPQNLVAAKDGMITEIIASSGTVLKEKYDYVKKGDIIVTGVIKNNETIMNQTDALGQVKAETWYTIEVEMPLNYYEEYYTEQEQKTWQFTLFSNSINLFNFNSYSKKEQTVEFYLGCNLFPLGLQYVTEKEKTIIDEEYTEEEAIIKAEELASTKLLATLEQGSEIIYQKTLKKTQNNSKIIIEVFFKVIEDITSYQEIIEENVEEIE